MLYIQLNPNGPADTDFPGGLTTGTFDLSKNKDDESSCGTCVEVWAGFSLNPTTLAFTQSGPSYTAQSGTLTITSLPDPTTGTGTLAGTLENVTLEAASSTPPSTCPTTTIPTLTFSGPSEKFICDASGSCTPG